MILLPLRMLAFVALVPAAANPSLVAQEGELTLALCQGGSISLPVGKELPGSRDNACCNKGCHAGEKRKRAVIAGQPAKP